MYDKAVSGQVAARLVELVGNSPGALDGELSKLSAYVGSRDQITGSDVDALTGQHREEKVFAVTDAMSVGDTSRALAHWEQVLATDRAAPGRAIAGLAWGIRRLLSARRDLDRGAHLMSVARRMYTEPHVLEQRLKNLSRARLETQLQDLCAADLAVKTGGSRLGSAIEQFIVRHSQSETQPANKR